MKVSWVRMLVLAASFVLAGCVQDEPPPAGRTTGQEAGKEQPVAADIPPQLLKQVVPRYPESARSKGIEGIIYVKALVDTDGTVISAEVIEREGNVPELQQPAVDAAKEMKFAPARQKDKAVKAWVTIPFKFALAKSTRDDVLSRLKRPHDREYVEGYLEGLEATRRQLEQELQNMRTRNVDTKEVRQTLQDLQTTIRALQAHLDTLKKKDSPP